MKRFSRIASLGLLCVALMAPAATGVETAAKPCPSGPEYHYVSRDPQLCLVILFFCDEGQAYFFNQCGCGCVDLVPKTAASPATRRAEPTGLEDLLAPVQQAAVTTCRLADPS